MGARDSPLPSSHAAPWLSRPRVLSAGARGFATVGHLRSTGLSASILSLSAMRPRAAVLLASLHDARAAPNAPRGRPPLSAESPRPLPPRRPPSSLPPAPAESDASDFPAGGVLRHRRRHPAADDDHRRAHGSGGDRCPRSEWESDPARTARACSCRMAHCRFSKPACRRRRTIRAPSRRSPRAWPSVRPPTVRCARCGQRGEFVRRTTLARDRRRPQPHTAGHHRARRGAATPPTRRRRAPRPRRFR